MSEGLTQEEAEAVWQILVDEGAVVSDYWKDNFVYTQTIAYNAEFRFQGVLGFGGKFRRSGDREDRWYVNCYPEDETPEILAIIEAINAKLAELRRTSRPV